MNQGVSPMPGKAKGDGRTSPAKSAPEAAPAPGRPAAGPDGAAAVVQQYDGSGVRFAGDPNASYERHLEFDHVIEPEQAGLREHFEALARALRDLLSGRWLDTQRTYDRANPKRVYYLSMEFLIGRSLASNIINLRAEPLVQEALRRESLDLEQLADTEPDAGLGNGGLGRLAACFL